MPKDFLIIAITHPSFIENEAYKICRILENKEADLVHIRKPGSSLNEMRNLIYHIPKEFHHSIKIHDHFQLLNEFELGGIHLNNRNPSANLLTKSISKSIHTIEEVENIANYDYVFLSPIFNSISKTGYNSKFKLDEIADKILNKNVIALGGVTPDKFSILKKSNFIGAALLGYFFPDIIKN